MTVSGLKIRPESKYLGATPIEPKMSINLYKEYTAGFLLKKTGFNRMTEVKF